MQLTNAELQELYNSLDALGGNNSEPNNEDKKEQYKFSGKTLLKLARNIHAIKYPALTLRDVVHRRHRDMMNGSERPSIEAMKLFEDEMTEMMKLSEEYKLSTINADELNLDENRVPPGILAGMIPILEE